MAGNNEYSGKGGFDTGNSPAFKAVYTEAFPRRSRRPPGYGGKRSQHERPSSRVPVGVPAEEPQVVRQRRCPVQLHHTCPGLVVAAARRQVDRDYGQPIAVYIPRGRPGAAVFVATVSGAAA